MMTQFDSIVMMRADTQRDEQSQRSTFGDLLAKVREVLQICDRAGAAAHRYEELSAQSDEDLAVQGLKRTDLPRKALEEFDR
jgi:hypothetical protein